MGTNCKWIAALVLGAGAAFVWSPPPVAAANSIVTVDGVDAVLGYTSVVLDAAGNPVVSYYDGGSSDLRVAHCNDPSCAGGGESIVAADSVGSVGPHSSLALDTAGNPVVSYHDIANADLKVVHCNDPNCAGGNESVVSVDGTGGLETSLALDAVGNPAISHYSPTRGELRVVRCNDANCAGGNESVVSVDDAGNVGFQSSLELDAAGSPVVSYFDQTNVDLKVLHCNDTMCAGGDESIVAVDTAGAGKHSSLELDAAGNPVISYHDSANGDLKVVHCNDASCAGGNESVETVDRTGVVGIDTTLSLDASGNPVIGYHHSSNGDLKVVHCNDANCAGGDERPVTVDSVGNVGRDASLVLDAAGNAVISYSDVTNEDLKLAHCDNAACAPQSCNGLAATIIGTGGDDVIDGTAGADVIFAGDGNDTINGRDGGDIICGGPGDDEVDGGDGDDRVFGDDGLDILGGGAGRDQLDGGDGPDTLAGDDGDDGLDGSSDDDYLTGGAGDDVLVGAAGNDELAGDDGFDTADFSAALTSVSVDLGTHLASGEGLDGLSGIERLVGSRFEDVLVGDAGDNVIDGGSGGDTIEGIDGVDELAGGEGSDRLVAGAGNDRLDGGIGTDLMFGDEDDDVVVGGTGVDFIRGGDGQDVLAGSAGSDRVFGDAGVDTATFATSLAAVTVDLTVGDATGDGTDALEGVENVVGSAFDDALIGDAASNVLDGGGGADRLEGGDGGDGLSGGPGDDAVHGDGGNDIVDGEDGDDILSGLGGDDVVDGAAGNDTVFGGRDDDVLVGGAGDDTLDGGDGRNTVSFAASPTAVTVDLGALSATGDGTDLVRSGRRRRRVELRRHAHRQCRRQRVRWRAWRRHDELCERSTCGVGEPHDWHGER